MRTSRMNHGTFSGIISDAHDIVPDMESEATTLKSHKGGETVEELRKTEIGVIGDVPWGTHICQFYQTREDLIDILVPYFKAGLENNEFCIWVTSEPLRVEEAKAALKKAVKNLDDYIKKGQIEILDYNEWYTRSGKFNADEVLQGWVEKEKLALEKGFSGLRLTGNTFWLESKDWKDFVEYEATVDSIIGKYRMIAICSYSMDICGAPEVIDVVSNHRFALIRREDKWVAIQSAEQAKAKEALRESEERLRLMFESVTDGITVTDLAGVITDMNERAVQMHGCHAKDEMLGRSAFELIAAREHEKAMTSLLKTLKEGIARSVEYALLKADGSEFPGELSASVLKDASGQAVGFIAITRDITERKRAEEEIRQNYQNQTALDALLRISLAAGSLQALLQDSLERLVSLPWLGLEPKGSIFLVENDPEVLMMKAQRGLTTPLLDACTRVPFGYCLCGRAASSGKVQFADRVDERHQTECQGLSHHGHYCVPILSAGKVMGVINLYLKEGHRRDEREVDFLKAAAKVLAGAIERKRAEEEVLRRNRELTALHRALISISQTLDLKEVLRQIISQAGMAVDSAYTSIVLVNHDGSPGMGAEDFVVIPPLSVRVRPQGVTRSIVNSGQTTVIDDAEGYEGISPALLKAGIKSYAGTPIKSKDKTIGVLFVASKQRNAFRDRVGLLTDFASQAAIAIENARLYEEASTVGALREADRLKTELLANVSHELRTPLASIKGYCTSMLHFYDRLTNDEKLDSLHEINWASDRLTELVENLLELSRLEATGFQIDKELTRIEPIITAAVEDMRRRAKEHHFVIHVAKLLPVVEADPRRIRQVIDNLLTNAVKYSSEGTEVSVFCEQKGRELMVSVRDQGVGIAPEEQVRIFERFYQVTLPGEGKPSGAGLGLAICKRIIEAHGGRIWVESAPGQRNTFEFTLPLTAEPDNNKGQ